MVVGVCVCGVCVCVRACVRAVCKENLHGCLSSLASIYRCMCVRTYVRMYDVAAQGIVSLDPAHFVVPLSNISSHLSHLIHLK